MEKIADFTIVFNVELTIDKEVLLEKLHECEDVDEMKKLIVENLVISIGQNDEG